MENKKNILNIKEYTVITLSLVLYTFGVAVFLIPAKIVSGGVAGISTLIYFISQKTIPVAVPYFLINIVLVVIGIKILGRNFGVKTLYGVVVTTLFFYIWDQIIIDPIVTDTFMATVIGSMCAGAGIGIAISQGGSTGGTDIIGLIINKYWNIATGKTMLYVDVVIISCSFFVFKSITPLIYGFVTMVILSYTIDFVITGRKQSVQFFIFTDKHDEIAMRVNQQLGRGISLLDSYGWHSQKAKKIVMILTRKTESKQVLRIVREIDDEAFISVSAVSGVYGQGFEEVRIRAKKELEEQKNDE